MENELNQIDLNDVDGDAELNKASAVQSAWRLLRNSTLSKIQCAETYGVTVAEMDKYQNYFKD